MIEIICRQETYRYSAYHMVRAFFPEEEASAHVASSAAEVEVHLDGLAEDISVMAPEGPFKKLDVERCLYEALKQRTGRELPWGLLLGVRPTKLASRMLEQGSSGEEFLDWIQKERFVSPEKAALSWEIAKREQKIIRRAADGAYSLYVGIPFCPSICSYCSFSSGEIGAWAGQVEPYLEALCRELAAVSDMMRGEKLSAIYIGGGTPTSLEPEQLDRLLGCLEEYFPGKLLEFTLEAGRPDSITEEKLRVALRHHISRISINPQSMQQKTLDAIGRRHTVEDVVEKFRLARQMGFDNINMDIIAGLPGEGEAEMEDTLHRIAALGPDSLTVHSLAIKRRAAMMRQVTDGQTVSKMIGMAGAAARSMGMEPYYLYRQKSIAGNFENTGYALPGKEGIYNVLIMEEVQSILACGAGGSSKIVLDEPVPDPSRGGQHMTKILRMSDAKAIDAYIRDVDGIICRKRECISGNWHKVLKEKHKKTEKT